MQAIRSACWGAVALGAALVLASCGDDGPTPLDLATDGTLADDTTDDAADDAGTGTTSLPELDLDFGGPDDDIAEVAPELGGTVWSGTDYSMATGGLTNVLSSTQVDLIFETTGTLSGTTGCREFTASWEVEGPYDEFQEGVRDEEDGQSISIEVVEVGEGECAEGFVAEQNDDILANLEGADSWFIARGNLILRGEGHYLEAEPG